MSLALLFLTGAVIGLIMVVPVGPVNLLTITRTLRFGFWAGFVAGLGGMAADVIFAALSAFGVSTVLDFVSGHKMPLQWIGGALLVVMGIMALRSHPHLDRMSDRAGQSSLVSGFLSAFAMTITNPGAAFGMLALFGSLGDLEALNAEPLSAVVVVAGVAAGSTLWWFGLATLVMRVRERMSDDWLTGINRGAGVILLVFGAVLLAGAGFGIDLV